MFGWLKRLLLGDPLDAVKKCEVCGKSLPYAHQVQRGVRYCSHLVMRDCPYDPRKGVYRQRR